MSETITRLNSSVNECSLAEFQEQLGALSNDWITENIDRSDEYGATLLTQASYSGRLDIVEKLIEVYGADVHAGRDYEGASAVCLAVRNQHWDTVQYLLDRGADINQPIEDGQTIMHLVAQLDFPLDKLEYLLQSGARIDILDNDGKSPLIHAIQFASVSHVLYLLHQKWVPIPPGELEKCTLLASEIGMAKIVLESLRLRNGSKFSSNVESLSEKLVRTRAIATTMNNTFMAHPRMSFRTYPCKVYVSLKEMVIESLRSYVPISDDILLAVVMHARMHHPNDHDEIWKEILSSAEACVAMKPRNDPRFNWFEEFLCTSAVWYEEDPKRPGQTMFLSGLVEIIERLDEPYPTLDDDKAGLIVGAVNEQKNEEKKEPDANVEEANGIRQDEIENGVRVSEDLLVQKIFREMDDSLGSISMETLLTSSSLTENDLRFLDSYDKSVYVTRLLSLCEGMHKSFASEMMYVNKMIEVGELKVAPVKAMERVVEKIGTDYNDEKKFPKSARILDLLRCSITFGKAEDLVSGFTVLCEYAKTDKSSDEEKEGWLAGIARLKNGFGDPTNTGYKDVKANVIFYSRKFDKAVIAEVQCILKSFLKVKKDQHRTYSVVRRRDVIDIVTKNASPDYADKLIYNGARFGKPKEICRGVMLGGNVNRHFEELDGFTALMAAAFNNQREVIPLLLNYGADKAATNTLEQNALFLAKEYNRNGVIDLLS